MTNKEFLCTLNTTQFESVIHALYFDPRIWINDPIRAHSTPTMFDVCDWLDAEYIAEEQIWKKMLLKD